MPEKQNKTSAKTTLETNKMKINELIESASKQSTTRSIVAALSSPINAYYEAVSDALQKMYDNKGSIKGSGMVIGGFSSRWVDRFYTNKLQRDLQDLVKQYPKATQDLKKFLDQYKTGTTLKFGDLQQELPEILEDVADEISDSALKHRAINWKTRRTELQKLVADLKDAEQEEPHTPAKKSKNKDSAVSSQLSQIETLVNNVLKDLPKKQAGEIRQAIAKSDNKLQALGAELQKRNIKLESVMHEAVFGESQ